MADESEITDAEIDPGIASEIDPGTESDVDAGPGEGDDAPLDTTNPDLMTTARRRYGRGGALLAAGMLGLEKILADKKKTESVQVQEAPSDPIDMDEDGITITVESTMVAAPALEPKPPVVGTSKKPRR